MPFTLFNTATRQKEELRTQEPGVVKIYACGPTVYDFFHVGNARAFIVFDTLRRVLADRGWKVVYVQNITDVDDKIIHKAEAEALPPEKLAAKYTEAFFQDLAALGCLPAHHHPKATEHMAEIIALVRKIMAAGHAYAVNGDIFFSVRSFPGYGSISGKNIDELEKGARVEINEAKQDPLDFALWKAAKKGEPSWDSPWGPGRPGWHIECSAMSMKYLGESFDIHAGGEDLIFPHHENENAQSQSVTGKPLARYWLHNGYLKIEGEKMSKSSGNFWIARDVLKVIPRQVLRLFMLSAHYRSPLDFNPENIEAAGHGYAEFQRTMERLRGIIRLPRQEDYLTDTTAAELEKELVETGRSFSAALEDDLNTAGALGFLFRLANKTRQIIAGRPPKTHQLLQVFHAVHEALGKMAEILGVLPEPQPVPEVVQKLIEQREAARLEKKWELSDQLREQIISRGYALEDTTFGSLALTQNQFILAELFTSQQATRGVPADRNRKK
ncbi:cysteine--tRNA ligase [candidate division FCPU426 bacterium]|nr:cysteine--tRNA ligase [candidate division FCPU426 bacterium]